MEILTSKTLCKKVLQTCYLAFKSIQSEFGREKKLRNLMGTWKLGNHWRRNIEVRCFNISHKCNQTFVVKYVSIIKISIASCDRETDLCKVFLIASLLILIIYFLKWLRIRTYAVCFLWNRCIQRQLHISNQLGWYEEEGDGHYWWSLAQLNYQRAREKFKEQSAAKSTDFHGYF